MLEPEPEMEPEPAKTNEPLDMDFAEWLALHNASQYEAAFREELAHGGRGFQLRFHLFEHFEAVLVLLRLAGLELLMPPGVHLMDFAHREVEREEA